MDNSEFDTQNKFVYMDISKENGEFKADFGEVNFFIENDRLKFRYKDYDESGNIEAEGVGDKLILNPTDWEGVIKVCSGEDGCDAATEYALYSADDGYFFSVDTDAVKSDFILSIGSSKPLQ